MFVLMFNVCVCVLVAAGVFCVNREQAKEHSTKERNPSPARRGPSSALWNHTCTPSGQYSHTGSGSSSSSSKVSASAKTVSFSLLNQTIDADNTIRSSSAAMAVVQPRPQRNERDCESEEEEEPRARSPAVPVPVPLLPPLEIDTANDTTTDSDANCEPLTATSDASAAQNATTSNATTLDSTSDAPRAGLARELSLSEPHGTRAGSVGETLLSSSLFVAPARTSIFLICLCLYRGGDAVRRRARPAAGGAHGEGGDCRAARDGQTHGSGLCDHKQRE